MEKMSELVNCVRKAEEEKCCKTMKTVLTVIGVIVVVVSIAYTVCKIVASLQKKDEDICDDVDVFEDEDSCIELEFTYAGKEEAEAAPAEVQEETAEVKAEEE